MDLEQESHRIDIIRTLKGVFFVDHNQTVYLVHTSPSLKVSLGVVAGWCFGRGVSHLMQKLISLAIVMLLRWNQVRLEPLTFIISNLEQF
jgi:hypothetical protein